MITPLAGFACNKNYNVKQNTTSNTTTIPKSQSFGMNIQPDMDSFNGLFKNYKIANSQNFLIKYFLTDTLEKHFDSATISNIFEEALIALKSKMGPECKDLKITDFIPDFQTKSVPLKLRADEDGLKGVLGDIYYDGVTNGDIIPDINWIDNASANREIFHDPIKNLIKKYAKKSLDLNNPYNRY